MASRTNIPFLIGRCSTSPTSAPAGVTTSFIEDHPDLLKARPNADRGTRLLTWLAEVTVNKPHGEAPVSVDPVSKLPDIDLERARRPTARGRRCSELGPEEFARRAARAAAGSAVTDTTFRDAHQSLLATRVRTRDLLAVAGHVARMTPELLSLEAWGGATYDVALRFLTEDPWDRLARLRQAVPNICLQMLLRGRNTVGYTPYPTEVTNAFVQEAAETGIDIFRIFDALNDVEQMRPAIEAVRETGTAVAEVALCYTGDLSNPDEKLYTLDYYLGLAERIVDAGAHVLAIKDMAGLLRAPAARTPGHRAARAVRPARAPAHPRHPRRAARPPCWPRSTPGWTPSTPPPPRWPARRPSPRCPPWSPPPTTPTARPGSTSSAVCALEPYWEATRRVYAPFESGLAVTDRPRLHPRDPRRPALQPAPAGRRARTR